MCCLSFFHSKSSPTEGYAAAEGTQHNLGKMNQEVQEFRAILSYIGSFEASLGYHDLAQTKDKQNTGLTLMCIGCVWALQQQSKHTANSMSGCPVGAYRVEAWVSD